jgi:hypothetical protein
MSKARDLLFENGAGPPAGALTMRIHLAITSLCLAVIVSAQAGIDFTPISGERVLEGMVFKEVRFHQDGHEIAYEPPHGWTYTGDAARLQLSPPGVSQAQASIEQSPLVAPQIFDEPTVKQLRQAALASVPSGAENVLLIGEEQNPLRINRQETYEVVVGYNFFGVDYQLSVLYLNLPDTQVRFRTVARKGDFEKVHREFRASLFGLNWR